MKSNNHFSILFPYYEDTVYKQLSDSACHDLGLDTLCRELTNDPREQNLIMSILSNMTADPRVAVYRQKVFVDILRLPELINKLTELFDRIEFLRKFSGSRMETDEKLGFWHLMHRLDELNDYIKCVEAMRDCLSDAEIKSEGLINFKGYIDELYNDACFAEMKKDIAELKIKSLKIESVTLGVNVNSRYNSVSRKLS